MTSLEERWAELGEFIRDQRETARLSLRRLSELAGVSNPYLSQIERGLRRPSADILQQIARALRISAETLYVRAGILEDRIQGSDVVDAILSDPELTRDHKDTLVRLYTALRRDSSAGLTDSADSVVPRGSRPQDEVRPDDVVVGGARPDDDASPGGR